MAYLEKKMVIYKFLYRYQVDTYIYIYTPFALSLERCPQESWYSDTFKKKLPFCTIDQQKFEAPQVIPPVVGHPISTGRNHGERLRVSTWKAWEDEKIMYQSDDFVGATMTFAAFT